MSSAQKVLLTLRKMIISGELAPGTRMAEIPTAEMLGGVSRQPVRLAFHLLEQEGLLIKNKTRGYSVRTLSDNIVDETLSIRAVLEGHAAALLAKKGLNTEQKKILLECITETDGIFHDLEFSDEQLKTFEKYNEIFHDTILNGSGNSALIQILNKTNQLPKFSRKETDSPSHLPVLINPSWNHDNDILMSEYQRLHYAHLQHCSIFEALLNKEANRAEMLMREHAKVTLLDKTIAKIAELNKKTVLK
ncbi:GntR family transcriptional regulator [Acinetobacter sichuanensis]|uniref:GntR family transcriptional regulator n=1 Tax=Acinetobacter sichuanensis TaxID=2136183 RepID=A0A371YL44_9GAMM|nr:GntR family transcriptional regulator [Acinetobacter sichuanensis]RFC82203.1 GntR family transcriptional regulator [Acinetobacter sichuanensis]